MDILELKKYNHWDSQYVINLQMQAIIICKKKGKVFCSYFSTFLLVK